MRFISDEAARAHDMAAAVREGGRYLAWPSGDDWTSSFCLEQSVNVPASAVMLANRVVVEATECRWSLERLARELCIALPTHQRAWETVAIWELSNVFQHGRFQAWMELSRTLGIADPLVRRPSLPHDGSWCGSIYLDDEGEPRWIRASVVLAGDRRGNLGCAPENWLPVVGPTHPGCHCPSWEFEIDDAAPIIHEAADELAKIFGL